MMLLKSCGRCGKIHKHGYKCEVGRDYSYKTEKDNLRNTNEWHNKAEQIKKDSQYLCSVCRDSGTYTYKNLEIHHIVKLRDDPSRLLDNYNLICLCRECHRLADENIIDKNYLYKLARKREANR